MKRYIQLTKAEAAFRTAKSDLGLRPVFHHKEGRAQALILVCFLALALWRTLEQWMQAKGLGSCARQLVKHSTCAAYDLAAQGSPAIRGVIPVGQVWNRAMQAGVADPNPYDGIEFGKVSLWTHDHYHGSTYGYYLEALMIFGDLTGLDPRSLGKGERAAHELGMSGAQAVALQQVAYDELMAMKGREPLKRFTSAAPAR